MRLINAAVKSAGTPGINCFRSTVKLKAWTSILHLCVLIITGSAANLHRYCCMVVVIMLVPININKSRYFLYY